MTENLRLTFDSTTALSPADTDTTRNIAAGTIAATENAETKTKWDPSDVNDASVLDAWNSYYDGTMIDGNGSSQYAGTYYNWYTATLSTGDFSMTSGVASDSICPSGWQLPSGTAAFNKSVGKLYETYGIVSGSGSAGFAKAKEVPVSMLPAGYYNSVTGQTESVGYAMNYWYASTTNAWRAAGALYSSSSNTDVYFTGAKRQGRTVRCTNR